MSPEVALPIIIPLMTGTLTLLAWRSNILQKILSVVGSIALLISSIWLLTSVKEQGHVVLYMGNWVAPYGITLVADMLSAIMVFLTGMTAVAIAVYSLASASASHERFGYYPLMHLLLAGVAGSFLTGDIFNLYVWFEVMLIASFALLILGGERAQMEGAVKYVTMNLLSSAIFLSAIGLLYGLVGTLNMADIAVKLSEAEHTGLVDVIAVMFMVAFGIKAAAFPLFFWLPASYHTGPVAVSALFAGLLTKVGVYALFRVFSLIFNQSIEFTHQLLIWIAVFTMVTGVLGAAAQFEFRRILSIHIISQIGYILLGLALFTPLALAGGVFFIIHIIIVKTNLFLISGITHRLLGTYELKKLGGIYKSRPFLSILFLVSALSLAGLPPLSGFFAKFILIRAGIEAEAWVATGAALFVGMLTLYSMIKIWSEVFWKSLPDETDSSAINQQMTPSLAILYLPVIILTVLTLLIGLMAQPIYMISEFAAEQLLNPSGYIEAVLGVKP
ncbi:MAG: Na+/H+ antiporter subunit D [Oceanospirillales bacterium]|nr:MAG: Na+/H+ antiporter subunit D [Oceanospirillales bacterium]